MIDVAETMTKAKTIMERAFAKYGRWNVAGLIMAMRDPKSGEPFESPTPIFITGDSPEMIRDAMRVASRRSAAVAAFMLMETWYSEHRGDGPIKYERASEDPNRKESLMIVGEAAGRERFAARAFITRDANGAGTIGEWDDVPGEITGRLTGILPELN